MVLLGDEVIQCLLVSSPIIFYSLVHLLKNFICVHIRSPRTRSHSDVSLEVVFARSVLYTIGFFLHIPYVSFALHYDTHVVVEPSIYSRIQFILVSGLGMYTVDAICVAAPSNKYLVFSHHLCVILLLTICTNEESIRWLILISVGTCSQFPVHAVYFIYKFTRCARLYCLYIMVFPILVCSLMAFHVFYLVLLIDESTTNDRFIYTYVVKILLYVVFVVDHLFWLVSHYEMTKCLYAKHLLHFLHVETQVVITEIDSIG
jgi:hypothetical protein